MKALTILLAVAALVFTAQADPRLWGENGVSVCEATHMEWTRSLATNPDGYSLAVWSEYRNGNRDIYGQMFSPQGEILWDSTGRRLIDDPGGQQLPMAAAVDNGWIVVWADWRNGYIPGQCGDDCLFTGHLRAQKFNTQGDPQWPFDNFTGIVVDEYHVYLKQTPQMRVVDDHAGGAFALWQDGEHFDSLRVQRIGGDGNLVWTQRTEFPTQQYIGDEGILCSSDQDGNLFYAATDNLGLRVHRIDANGNLPWGGDGAPLPDDSVYGYNPAVCADETGGCFVGWVRRVSNNYAVHVQRVSANGTRVWQPGGAMLYSGEGQRWRIQLALSQVWGSTDGVITAWQDYRSGSSPLHIYLQKIGLDGAMLWTPGGYGVNTTLAGRGYRPRLLSDNVGGALISWMQDLGSMYAIYAHHLSDECIPVWSSAFPAVEFPSSVDDVWLSMGRSPNGILIAAYHTPADTDDGSIVAMQFMGLDDGAALWGLQGLSLRANNERYTSEPQVVAMSDNRTAIIWDEWGNGRTIRYNILDANGVPAFGREGRRLVATELISAHSIYTAVRPDEHGGFFAAFCDVSFEDWYIRVTRITASGEQIGGPAGTIVTHEGDLPYSCNPTIISDGSGGCYVEWMDAAVVRVNSQCEGIWPGALRVDQSGDPGIHSYGIYPTGDGNFYWVWQINYGSSQSHPQNIRVARSDDLSFQWTITAGEEPCAMVHGLKAAVDANGFLCLGWYGIEYECGMRNRHVTQLISPAGERMWGDGIVVTDTLTNVTLAAITPGSDGSFFYLWSNENYPSAQLFGQRFARNGTPQWGDSGRTLITQSAGFYDLKAIPDWLGNPLVVWSSWDSTHCLRGLSLDPDGQPTDPWWSLGTGGLVMDSVNFTSDPTLAIGPDRSLIVASRFMNRQELRNAQEIHVQRILPHLLSSDPTAGDAIPTEYALSQNYPNPFNPETRIQFALPHSGMTTLRVYDLLGREVVTLVSGKLGAGYHEAAFNASGLASGMYFYRLDAETFSQTKKMILLR